MTSVISLFVGNKTNDLVHDDFKNPPFFPTRNELLAWASFQILEIDSDETPHFTVGSPAYIQVAVKEKKNGKEI